jgi:hypothetical protein
MCGWQRAAPCFPEGFQKKEALKDELKIQLLSAPKLRLKIEKRRDLSLFHLSGFPDLVFVLFLGRTRGSGLG